MQQRVKMIMYFDKAFHQESLSSYIYQTEQWFFTSLSETGWVNPTKLY